MQRLIESSRRPRELTRLAARRIRAIKANLMERPGGSASRHVCENGAIKANPMERPKRPRDSTPDLWAWRNPRDQSQFPGALGEGGQGVAMGATGCIQLVFQPWLASHGLNTTRGTRRGFPSTISRGGTARSKPIPRGGRRGRGTRHPTCGCGEIRAIKANPAGGSRTGADRIADGRKMPGEILS